MTNHKEMFGVFYTNLGYGSCEYHTSIDAAVDYAKRHGFEASIVVHNRNGNPKGQVIASWSPIGGYREI